MYEPPLIVDDSRSTTEDDWVRIGEAVAADRRSDAVRIFLKSVGLPSFFIALMRLLPMWSKLKALAHTLPYDGAVMRDNQRGQPLPSGRWASITVPALVMAGGNSPAWMRHGNKSLARVITERAVPLARRPDPHVESEGARAPVGGILQKIRPMLQGALAAPQRSGRYVA